MSLDTWLVDWRNTINCIRCNAPLEDTHTCPKCGYKLEFVECSVCNADIPRIGRIARRVSDLQAKLDDKYFCVKCAIGDEFTYYSHTELLMYTKPYSSIPITQVPSMDKVFEDEFIEQTKTK